MPGQQLTQPNTPPDPSHIPDSISQQAVQLEYKNFLNQDDLISIQSFRRAADYIAAAMIFLRNNIFLERDLAFDDIKPRLLGHWGTCPGLVLIYARLNKIVCDTDVEMLYVVGPGHGAPGILACLWLEDSLGTFWPKYSRNYEGLFNLIATFSVPGGFPSHINGQTPGAIHEGGESGYALSVAFGAAMDNPDLIIPCVIGDGEAESGPTAAAWHGFKYIDPAESGAVLPILHINGFKISERTIYGAMDDRELVSLFVGYGYQPRIVEDMENIDHDLAASLSWAISEIHKIQHATRPGSPIVKPCWPVILLRALKEDRPVHFNYHGYPFELQGLLFGRPGLMERVTIARYKEEGTTTSPFDMMLCNNISRFDVATAAIRGGSRVSPKVAVNAHIEMSALRHEAKKVQDYIYKHGEDPEETYATPSFD
ncbi:putative phosphoketolase [Leucoagaricus sp. SymC.cos]|nr:putative phosphoketolase [Leucoagaricus sp. SymC.cos]